MQRVKDLSEMEEKMKTVESLLETSRNDQFQLKISVKRKQEEGNNLKHELNQTKRELGE